MEFNSEAELALRWEELKHDAQNAGMQLLIKYDDFIIVNDNLHVYTATNLQDISEYLKKFNVHCKKFFQENESDI